MLGGIAIGEKIDLVRIVTAATPEPALVIGWAVISLIGCSIGWKVRRR
jgi:hypothetical protein